MSRLPQIQGELIDRTRAVEFSFEGQQLRGFEGDTISSALLANDVRILGRSFKYHRPRGVLSAVGHDANVIVQLKTRGRSVPNLHADLTRVQSGWELLAVNTRGGVRHDRLAYIDRLGALLPVGFYYKAFYSKRWFPRWERMFRRMAGLGEVDLQAPRQPTPKRYDFCDVLVIGAGPSGLSAALAAAGQGAGVLLVEEQSAPGGSARYARGGAAQMDERVAAMIDQVRDHPRIRVLTDTYAAGYYSDHWVALIASDCMIKVRARSVVVAQGAYEQPAVFHGNDLPGVMLATAAQRLIYYHAVRPAQRVAVVTANAQGYAAALDALAHGIEVAAVVDLRASAGAAANAACERLAAHGIPLHHGAEHLEAESGRDGLLAALSVRSRVAAGALAQRLAVDGVWMSVGFAPANALLHQANVVMGYEGAIEQFVPRQLPSGVHACGKVNGVYGLDERLTDGRRAGAAAAAGVGFGKATPAGERVAPEECPTHPYPMFPHPHAREFIDFDEDVQVKDILNACQEGFDSSELLKRFTTIGMGPSQGKHSNMNALRVLARVRGEPLERLGTTTARPMFHPVPLAHLAGRGFTPERHTPLHGEHQALGAVWMPAANWRRPEYYAVAGKSREQAIADEVRAVRTRVGLIDVGTLGKIEAHGPQAGQFLERIYTARFANLKEGMTRYGLMLDEAGTIIDDGVIARLGPELFYFTTTTGNSGVLYNEFGRLATWWGIPVGLVNVTGHYAGFNLAGPLSRAVLREHTDLDLSDAAFPYLGVRQAEIAGAPCRLMRVGFVGELGYEIHVPFEHAVQVWRALMASGARHGIQPFGVEAQRMLRLEKGHIIVGQDTDGLTNALEINASWALKMDKPFFVGQRSLRMLERMPRRQTLIGFMLPAGTPQLPKEGHLIFDGTSIAGRITSVGMSPTLGRCIGMALVTPRVAEGKSVHIRVSRSQMLEAELAHPPFYDPKGERQRVDPQVERALVSEPA
jgi:sarcosine oxidase subunit alpha